MVEMELYDLVGTESTWPIFQHFKTGYLSRLELKDPQGPRSLWAQVEIFVIG